MTTTIVIPARLGSRRMATKLLRDDTGKPLLQHTIEAAQKVSDAQVLVAADSIRFKEIAERCGVYFWQGGENCWCGTHRVYVALHALGWMEADDVVVNWQADEPEVCPGTVRWVSRAPVPRGRIRTLCCPLSLEQVDDQQVVKVRNEPAGAIFTRGGPGWMPIPQQWHQHIGLYVFCWSTLCRIGSRPQSQVAREAKLEQLNWEQEEIIAYNVPRVPAGINTEADYEEFRKRWIMKSNEEELTRDVWSCLEESEGQTGQRGK